MGPTMLGLVVLSLGEYKIPCHNQPAQICRVHPEALPLLPILATIDAKGNRVNRALNSVIELLRAYATDIVCRD